MVGSLYISPLLISATVSLVLALYAWHRRSWPGLKHFGVLMLALSVMLGAGAIQLAMIDPADQLPWFRLRKAASQALVPSFLLWVMHLAGVEGRLTRARRLLIYLVPCLTALFLANDTLFRFALEPAPPNEVGAILFLGPRPWRSVNLATLTLELLLAVVLLVRALVRGSGLMRRQAAVTLLAFSLPGLMGLIQALGWAGNDWPVELSHIGFVFTGLLILWAMERFPLFDIMPNARSAIVGSMQDGVLVLDVLDRITAMNPAAEQLLNHSYRSLAGEPVATLLDPEVVHSPESVEVEWAQGDQTCTYDVRGTPILDARRRKVGRLLVVRDVSSRREMEQRLRYAATHDHLTGLPNRMDFTARLGERLRNARYPDSYGIVLLDLDRFKHVNDSQGHQTGDRLLIAAARRLEAAIPDNAVVARFGGDEFAVLLASVQSAHHAAQLAQTLLIALGRPFDLGDQPVFVSASAGVVLGRLEYTNPDQLIRDADVALYRAKDAGRSQLRLFDSAMHHAVLRRMALDNELRHALGRGELRLVYQPVVALRTQELRSFEALLRWDHPTRGPISPAEFIPLAEESGFILELGDWVLDQACLQLQSWRRRFPQCAVRVQVNVSPRQFQGPVVEQVMQALEGHNLPAGLLGLEITEGAVLEDIEAASFTVQELRGLGVKLHLDDFGTGYSSLSHLARLAPQTIKIDRSFVKDLGSNDRAEAVVLSIINLARTLDMKVTAEGIETEDQLKILHRMGADHGQGYLLARPLDVEDCDPWLRRSETVSPEVSPRRIYRDAQRSSGLAKPRDR